MLLWASLLLIVIAVLAMPIGRATTGDFFAPASLFVLSWCGTLGLFFLRLLPYPPLSTDTAVLLTGTIVVFVLAAIAGQRLASPAKTPLARPAMSMDRWIAVYSVLGLAGVAWYVYLVARILGWSAFETGYDIRVALGEYRIPSAFLFLEYFCIATPLVACAVVLCGVRLRPMTWLGPIACALATWITTDRTQFFVLVLGVWFMYMFSRAPRLTWRGLATAAVVAAVLLASNFLIVGAWQRKTPEALAVKAGLPSMTASAPASTPSPSTSASSGSVNTGAQAKPSTADSMTARVDRFVRGSSTLYLYATGSFGALNVLLQYPMGTTHGVFTIYPVARLLERAGLIRGPLPAAIPQDLPLGLGPVGHDINFNGYTFLYYPLMDFGRIGALAYTAVFGVLSGWLYGLMRTRRQSPLYLLLMAHLSTALVLSVFVNKFNNTATWYIVAATAAPFVLFARRRSNA